MRSETAAPTSLKTVMRGVELAQRVATVVNLLGGDDKAGRVAGKSSRQIRRYVSGAVANPPGSVLAKLAKSAKVDLGWLTTGDGQMRPEGQGKDATPLPAVLDSDFVLVPRYDIEASAGPGTFSDHEKVADYMAFRADWVRRALGVDPTKLVLITAAGDSMEPAIRAGDVLLVDRSVTRVIDDAIYVVVKHDHLVVKRLQSFFTGAVTVKSDNAAYVEETLGADEALNLIVAGRVRWIGRLI